MRPLPLAAGLLGLALVAGASAARAETAVAAIEPSRAVERVELGPASIRAVLASEARHLAAGVRDVIARAVVRASEQHGVPALLLLALIAQESGFDPNAENGAAVGLMQVERRTAELYSAERGLPFAGDPTLRDPARNIALGSSYFGHLLDRFGSTDLALAAYNKGPEAVRRDLLADREPGRRFVADVLRRYQHYHARFGGI